MQKVVRPNRTDIMDNQGLHQNETSDSDNDSVSTVGGNVNEDVVERRHSLRDRPQRVIEGAIPWSALDDT